MVDILIVISVVSEELDDTSVFFLSKTEGVCSELQCDY